MAFILTGILLCFALAVVISGLVDSADDSWYWKSKTKKASRKQWTFKE